MNIDTLVDDLAAEQSSLDAVVSPLGESDWSCQTPAEGWTIRHQIAHLTYFDEAAVTALEHPETFLELRDEARADPVNYGSRVLEPLIELSAQELIGKWRAARSDINRALASTGKETRVPWYGPAMSVASMATARLMETWAHGQDVVDALGVTRKSSRRLEHVARLACLARPYSYLVRDLPIPDGSLRVVLEGPDGEVWTFGESEAESVVTGTLEEFCMVLTRRRHVADTGLSASGEIAAEWLEIGQAYAGSPGTGRTQGQFTPS